MTVWKKFSLPDDDYDYKVSNMANDMMLMLWDFSQHLRSELKYNDNLTEEQWECLDKLRDKFYELIGDYNIDLDL